MPIDPDVAARIKAALDGVDTQPDVTEDPFRKVLEDFTVMLAEHATIGMVVGAKVEAEPALLGGQSIVTWPKLRRDQRAPLLTFARDNTSIVVLDEQRRAFREPDQLLEYLLAFLKTPAFRTTFSLYAERCTMPVKGFLRVGGPNEIEIGDVLVRVDPVEQAKIVRGVTGQAIEFLVTEDRMPSASQYRKDATYTCLVAGGYGVWVKTHNRADGSRLRLSGAPMTEMDLA